MIKKIIILIIILVGSIYIIPNVKNINKNLINHSNIKIKKFNPSDLIIHHISDSYEWVLLGEGKNAIIIDLPIIIWDNGFKCFMSSDFRKNNGLVKKNGILYKKIENKIYKLLYSNNYINNKLYSIKEIIFDFSITKNVVMIFLSTIILIFIFINIKNSYKKDKKNIHLKKIFEPLIIFVRDEIAIPYLGNKQYSKYLPFLLTLFFFILINNLLGLLPGAPNIIGNINITFVLSFLTFIIIHINANKNYWKHIFWMPGIPIIIRLLLLPIELSGIFIKPMTLCIRLFSNMVAGHIIILSFISLIFVFKNIFYATIFIPFAIFVSLLEILVSFLQAFIFTTLSALFLGMAIIENNKHN